MTRNHGEPRYAFGPLERVIVGLDLRLSDVMSGSTINRYRAEGVPEFRADELACKLGRHPGELWDEWWANA